MTARAPTVVGSVLRTARRRLRPAAGGVSDEDLADIQGNVLRAYDNDHVAHLLVAVRDPRAGRCLLRDLHGRVTTATPWERPPRVTTNVAVTFAGLHVLEVSGDVLDDFPVAFRQGVRRAPMLGDREQSHPDEWTVGFRDDEVHLVVTLTAWQADHLDDALGELTQRLEGDEHLDLLVTQQAERFGDRCEHFGFVDGIAQPRLAGIDRRGTPTTGTPHPHHWEPLPIGEFVLGHRDAEGVRSPAPGGAWGRNGSYVVIRKLRQDVAAFRSLVEDVGVGYPGGATELAAKIVGRWQDGTPLAASPDGPDPAIAADPARVNDFRFGDDEAGERCPVGSHVRRVNPRDGAGVGGSMTTRHRMIRRGVPYGPRLDADARDDDGEDRGLVFVCFVADIERQFEFVQRHWVNDGDVLGAGHDADPLVGRPQPNARFKVPGRDGAPPYLLPLEQPLVAVRGSLYLFQPGLRALRRLADGRV